VVRMIGLEPTLPRGNWNLNVKHCVSWAFAGFHPVDSMRNHYRLPSPSFGAMGTVTGTIGVNESPSDRSKLEGHIGIE
jgi:hypothetical protein